MFLWRTGFSCAADTFFASVNIFLFLTV